MVTTRLGVAITDAHPDDERIIQRSDAALYAAKNTWRNCVVLT
ncbi:MAG: hypothetical protein ACNA75_05325 [Thiohalomonadaceae bacterium]